MRPPVEPLSGRGPTAPRFVFFAHGFRPFFLLAGLSAALLLPLWLAVLAGAAAPPGGLVPSFWHAHEMLYGFAAAALAGFLLTAAPNWTNSRPVQGAPLAGLVLLWLAGRLSPWLYPLAPAAAAAFDLAFLPAVAAWLGAALFRAGNRRNYVFLPLIGSLVAANALVHLEYAGLAATGALGLRLAIGVLVLTIAVVGGRIVPSFTQNALRAGGEAVVIAPKPAVERLALGSLALLVIADLIPGAGVAAGALALLAGAVHAYRLSGWHGARTLHSPILWVLHLGYAWIVAGLWLKGLAGLTGLLPETAALHALTVGGVGTMTMAVMSRAALGHTGRPLVAPKPVAAAYVCISLAALLRVLGPLLPGAAYTGMLHGSGLFWTLGFGLFALTYAPMVFAPRLDGKPG